MRTMYDGINSDADVLPADAQLIAGYVDGDYAWSAVDWARFPHAVHVRIAVDSRTNAGQVLDVENGDATPAESVGWVLVRRAAGADPTIYCNTSTWPAVIAAHAARDVPLPHWWAASYNGDKALPAGAVAHQYESDSRWDISSVADYWPGVDPAPVSKLAQLEEYNMSQMSQDGLVQLAWPTGHCHVVQAAGDRRWGPIDVRAVLLLPSGELVLAESWKPTPAAKALEIPAQYVATAYGIELQPNGTAAMKYAACAV